MTAYLNALQDAGAQIFEVGGTVRDRLLGRKTKDRDYLVRNLTIKQITRVLSPFGKVALVGQSFGVIKFTPHQNHDTIIDFTLPRKERSTGIGHRDFDVAFDPFLPVEEDLGRRDFTINAMAMDVKTEKIIDPYRGQKDLAARKLRQVFPMAFEEDPLRILRGIQFATRFKLSIEEETFSSMKKNAHLIATVSPERISEELKKLFLADTPSAGFKMMEQCGLLPHIFPELAALRGIEQDKQPGEDVYDHTMRALDAARSDPNMENRGNLDLLFAVLLHDIGKSKTSRYHEPSKRVVFFGHQIVSARMAKRILKKFRVETIGVDINNVAKLITNHMFETKPFFSERAIRRFIHKVGKELMPLLLDLRLADNRGGKHPHSIKGVLNLRKRIKEELERKPPFGPKDLAIKGNDIMGLGIPQGPLVGAILQQLVFLVLDNPELNTREQLLALVKHLRENQKESGGAVECEKESSKSKKTKSRSREGCGHASHPHR